MKWFRKLFLFLIFIGLALTVPTKIFSQSKTDSVEDKLNGKDKDSKSGISTESSDEVNGFFAELFVEIGRLVFGYLLYIDEYEEQPVTMRYNPYPYFYDFKGINTVRSLNGDLKSSKYYSLDLSRPPLTNTDSNFGLQLGYSRGFWGVHGQYRLWDEVGARKYMHQLNLDIERKMRWFPQSEAGLLLGYGQINIRAAAYPGLTFGFRSDYYWVKPISGFLIWRGTIYNTTYSSQWQSGLRYHFKNSAIILNYQSLGFGEDVFRGLQLGYSFWF